MAPKPVRARAALDLGDHADEPAMPDPDAQEVADGRARFVERGRGQANMRLGTSHGHDRPDRFVVAQVPAGRRLKIVRTLGTRPFHRARRGFDSGAASRLRFCAQILFALLSPEPGVREATRVRVMGLRRCSCPKGLKPAGSTRSSRWRRCRSFSSCRAARSRSPAAARPPAGKPNCSPRPARASKSMRPSPPPSSWR